MITGRPRRREHSTAQKRFMWIRTFLCSLLCGSAFCVLWFAWHLQYEYSNWPTNKPEQAYRYSSLLLTWYAEQLSVGGNLIRAKQVYQQALAINPLYPPAWLGIAGLEDDRGNRANANQVLDFIALQTREIQRWSWNKTLLAYRLGRNDVLARELPYLIDNVSGKLKDDAMRMAFTIWPNMPELRAVLDKQIPALFRYAVRTGRHQHAMMLWPEISSQLEDVPRQELVRFITQLIVQKEWEIAKQAWTEITGSGNGMIHDGSFLAMPLQGAFGWRIGDVKGCSWNIEAQPDNGQKGNSLHVHFTGQENVQYQHVSQIIPVEGGKNYHLSAYWKGKKLTTDQRPYVELLPYGCAGAGSKSAIIDADTGGWQEVQLEMQVPEECHAVLFRLRRQQSLQIDNRLSGDFWMTGVNLSQRNL